MARMLLPIQEAVRDLASDLLGRGVAVDKAIDPIDPEDMAAIAVYRSNDGTVQVAAAADRPMVAILGGALVLVPEVVVREMIRKQDIADNLYDNFWEVANIMTSLLNRDGVPHMTLTDRVPRYELLGDEVRALFEAPVRKRSFSVTVVGYGSGRISFVAAT